LLSASLGAACSSTAGDFLAFRLLQAVGASAALVATFATVRDVYADRPENAVIYGLFSSMLAFVPAIGPVAGALIAESFGWRAIFVTLAALAALAIANASLRWHETRPAIGTGPRPSVLPIFTSLPFWVYTVGFSAGMGSFFVFFSTAPRVLIGRAGYSEFGFSLAFATVALVMIATRDHACPHHSGLACFGRFPPSEVRNISSDSSRGRKSPKPKLLECPRRMGPATGSAKRKRTL